MKNSNFPKQKDPNYDPLQDIIQEKKKSSYHIPANFSKKNWKKDEDRLYVGYLKLNRKMLNDPQERKKGKIFKNMSKFIVRRTPTQCRSHHQKMMIKFGSIDQIIQNLSEDWLMDTQQNKNNEYESLHLTKQKQIQDNFFQFDMEKIQEDLSRNSQQPQLVELTDKQDFWNIMDINIWTQPSRLGQFL